MSLAIFDCPHGLHCSQLLRVDRTRPVPWHAWVFGNVLRCPHPLRRVQERQVGTAGWHCRAVGTEALRGVLVRAVRGDVVAFIGARENKMFSLAPPFHFLVYSSYDTKNSNRSWNNHSSNHCYYKCFFDNEEKFFDRRNIIYTI